MIYHDATVAAAVADNPQSAPIPDLHKAVFNLARLFVQSSWSATPADLDAARAVGASERDLSEWLQIASIQTWFTHSADAGGIPLEGNAVTGPVLRHERDFYHDGNPVAALPCAPRADTREVPGSGWLEGSLDDARFVAAAAEARGRYGLTPRLFEAISACPDFYARHLLALRLLERPQSDALDARLHARVRAATVALDRCGYFEPTVLEQARRAGISASKLADFADPGGDSDTEQVVLAFVHKMARSPYRITADDAARFRQSGLSDSAYVEVFNTVAIQQSLDRLANCCGVAADASALLPRR